MTVQRMLTAYPIGQIAALGGVLLGVVSIIMGVQVSKWAALSSAWEAMWLRHVRGLGRGEEPHEHSPEVLQAAQRRWLQHLGAMNVGTGIGILIGLVVSFALAQVALRAPFSLPFGLIFLFFMPPPWGLLLGRTWSSILAARRQLASRIGDARVARPDLSHTISDYRSPLLPLIGAFPAVVYTVLTIVVAPHYQPFSSFEQSYYALIAPPRWILASYPCALWLNVLLAEGCAWARVRAPGAVLSTDTALARRVSMGLIGEDLVAIYGTLLYVPLIMGFGMGMYLQTTSEIMPYGVFMTVAFGTLLVCAFGGVRIITSQGRLGGRLTGWAWSKGATRENGAAAARGDGAV